MPEPEIQDPFRQQILHAINVCIQAYLGVKAKLPSDASYSSRQENHEAACSAYLAKLPILCDLASFQFYVACIAHGASIGAVDPVDIGRFCHLAQTAMSAWKLANLIVPAAKNREMQATRNKQNEADPLPTKGNQVEDRQSLQAASQLPDRKTQMDLYKSLRQRGIPVPSEIDLRNNPLVALYYCDLAQHYLDKLPPPYDQRGPEPSPEPAPGPQQQPKQAA
ncbi:MAG TPA: hypothetical protein VG267_09465 [Terracidiphilus sp.]|jgi:hypothetical protein|nr:hypothetical protein [Terracidiphilus sp.]